MNASPDLKTRKEVIDAYRAQLQAMTDGDTDALDALLDDGFTLTHVTGDEQPKDEWLAQVRAGEFACRWVEEKTVTVDADADGGTARLVGRIITDATLYGSRADWRLQLTMDYARVGDDWIALRSAARRW
ncbi:nuclear transport factor 2 family protein [Streptomyces sp. DH24]|uniref:nuclear transport factor 2 family protein n=1 Tax=Streptomyces sp. DH24 TaxID=3040123 RepID=UPI002441575B|nr:nuclear transport factor 2 family protein [Streptomyces sp. DH24]MDG9717573.1 nuclear transport factor 2 family protein [Streptomyces sp. DH24]